MFVEILLFSLAVNVTMFIPAFLFKTDKLTDISYVLTFILIIWYLLAENSITFAHGLLATMVLLWAVRLGGFLLVRIHKMKKDKRFDEMRSSFVKFLGFWLLQALTVWVVLLGVIAFFSTPGKPHLFGVGIWLIGMLFEGIADWQKYQFKQQAKNKGKFITTGLWGRCRHPNYFGEILCWLGIFIYVLPALSGWLLLLAFLSPVYIYILLVYVSGIPLLEKAGQKKWGDDPAYQKHLEQTCKLVPCWK